MKWICLKCGRKNDQQNDHCTKCGLEEEAALTYPVSKRRRSCEECGHIHREDMYCHVYTEAADTELLDGVISEDSEEDDDDDDGGGNDDDSDDFRGSKPQTPALSSGGRPMRRKKFRPLKTPLYAKQANFVRCNCNVGVPDSMRFEPIPQILVIGGIPIEMYHEIMDPDSRRRFQDYQSAKFSQTALARKAEQDAMQIAETLPLVMSFLRYGECAPVPQVCTLWNYGTSLYKEYIDIRNCVPMQAFRPHTGQVDSALVDKEKVYSGGDHRILVSNHLTGELLSQVTRDSGDVTQIRLHAGELFCCSTNGSIRTYAITHTGQNIQLTNTMWEHTRAICDLSTSIPSDGPCELHGIEKHVCFMYSASEDRTVKMWGMQRMRCEKTISNNSLRRGSYTQLAQSDRHLFAGTTVATIAVFNKQARCERDDVHACNVPGADVYYCLQISLKLPNNLTASGNLPLVTGLSCPRIGPEFPTLWATDSSGQMTIWYVPRSGLDFTPAYTVKAHRGSITQMAQTWRHMITIGDDCMVQLFDVLSFAKIRTIDVQASAVERNLLVAPHIRRRLKCAGVYENYSTGGYLALGTSYGDIIMMPLGTTV